MTEGLQVNKQREKQIGRQRERGVEEKETGDIARLIYSSNNAWNHKPQVLRRESSTLINTEHKGTRLRRGWKDEQARGWKEGGSNERMGTDGFALHVTISVAIAGMETSCRWWTEGGKEKETRGREVGQESEGERVAQRGGARG